MATQATFYLPTILNSVQIALGNSNINYLSIDHVVRYYQFKFCDPILVLNYLHYDTPLKIF